MLTVSILVFELLSKSKKALIKNHKGTFNEAIEAKWIVNFHGFAVELNQFSVVRDSHSLISSTGSLITG